MSSPQAGPGPDIDLDLDFSDLRALFINCTLKPSPQPSNTEVLMSNAAAILRAHGVAVDHVRAADNVTRRACRRT